MRTGNFNYNGGTYSFTAENITHSTQRIVGYSSHCFTVRILSPQGGSIKVKLLSNKWIEEYDRLAQVPWPNLRTDSLGKIVSAALLEGWNEKSEFDLEDFDLGNHLTLNRIEEFRQSDKHPIPIQSLSF